MEIETKTWFTSFRKTWGKLYSLLNAYCFLTISWGSEENISLHFEVLLYSPKSVNGGYCSENMDSDLNWISYSITA